MRWGVCVKCEVLIPTSPCPPRPVVLPRVACLQEEHNYSSKVMAALVVPFFSGAVNVVSMSVLRSRGSIGEPAPLGQAINDERNKRDWYVIRAIKYSNMACIWTVPSACNVFARAFASRTFDRGDGKADSYMTADLSVQEGTAEHNEIIVWATLSMCYCLCLLVYVLLFMLVPIRNHLEHRTGRYCSPLIDFVSMSTRENSNHLPALLRKCACTHTHTHTPTLKRTRTAYGQVGPSLLVLWHDRHGAADCGHGQPVRIR